LGCVLIILGTVVVAIPIGTSQKPGGATGFSAFIWPFIFTLGFLSAAVKITYSERTLKSGNKQKKVDLIYFLFFSSLFQLLTATVLFWTDIIPWFGLSDGSFSAFWKAMMVGFSDTVTNMTALFSSILFILFYVIYYIAGNDLLRYDKGATWLAVVTTFVTPLGILWWNFFNEVPFYFHMQFKWSNIYTFVGAGIML
jgi:hypothetical protein